MKNTQQGEEDIEKLGSRIIEFLGLKTKPNGRVNTGWGDKTPFGLGACILRIVEEENKKAIDSE